MSIIQKSIMFALFFVALVLPVSSAGKVVRGVAWATESTSYTNGPVETLVPIVLPSSAPASETTAYTSSAPVETLIPTVVQSSPYPPSVSDTTAYTSSAPTDTLVPVVVSSVPVTNTLTTTQITSSLEILSPIPSTSASGYPSVSPSVVTGTYANSTSVVPSTTLTSTTASTTTKTSATSSGPASSTVVHTGGAMEANTISGGLLAAAFAAAYFI
ncbi:hypothetical protein BCON_0068g00190 [Botryotinia convoluta]|uniref:Uncharacterized protein n=1 Tax=Botryotinia convoluta TaxID=54673 RepID=A0A4Z1I6I5_9HELO|nr:hypothetical protein BCON_0068g00190 [Botryotinia convoluta]